MSIGLYRHPTLGQSRKYILNNKYVLQIKTETKQTEDWNRKFAIFKENFLGNKQYLPITTKFKEIYVDREAAFEYQQNSKIEPTRVIIYEHFVVTLREELQMRIKSQEDFSINELWFFLYAFACGGLEMIQVHEKFKPEEDLEINPQTILLNEYGYIKLQGFFSAPFSVHSKGLYKGKSVKDLAPENLLSPQALPHKLQMCCSAAFGRILSSLILLKELDQFMDPKIKLFCDQKLLGELKAQEERLGVLYQIIKLMFASNLDDRLMISEIKAMLLPYEEQILSLKDFTLDREASRQSMINLFVKSNE